MNKTVLLVGAGLGIAAFMLMRRRDPGATAEAPTRTKDDGRTIQVSRRPSPVSPSVQSQAVRDQAAGADIASRPGAPTMGSFSAVAFMPVRRSGTTIDAIRPVQTTGAPRGVTAVPDSSGIESDPLRGGPGGGFAYI